MKTAQDIVAHVEAASKRGEDRLVVVDEVQQIEQWERALASLNGRPLTRVIISGSNASMFSGELATRIAVHDIISGPVSAKRVADSLAARLPWTQSWTTWHTLMKRFC